jgi:GTPase Era involved in 16S rRNA processing
MSNIQGGKKMSMAYLQMKYHPAKKEVEFRRFENDKELAIQGGRLQRYMNKKGQFVLQDHGNEFFRDIARAFDSIKTLEMKVITTKLDYEDLEQMIEYYNADPESQCKITPTLIAELPDMKQTYMEVAKYGEHAIAVLKSHRQKLFDIKSISNDAVKKSAESFAEQIDEEANNIRKKIDSMSDNKVSLCFTGVYSAGKSALINSMLGYKILPEKITSETAKMFQISSPKTGKPVQIIFDIDNVKTVLEWNDKKKTMEFVQGPSENDERAQIQEKINLLKEAGKERHEHIYALLEKLNSMDALSHDIEIIFPIPLDSEAVQFTIYDTPGTDSNYLEHQEVLMDALSEQKQSILIFVAAPNKTEGTGNNALLKYLKEAELKDSKTSIDLGRSLFVINWSDSIDSDAREDLQCEEIKYMKKGEGENEKPVLDFSIKLSDKKLFFTSAKMAYAAKAKKNGIATPKEESIFKRGLGDMQDEFEGYVYRQNRFAASEFATEKMHSQCEEALEKARSNGDDVAILEICSGIYALEKEIVQYGEKYASAVKAYAIINSVNKALSNLSNRANSLKESNQEDVRNIQRNIDQLRETINSAIEEEYNNKAVPENAALPDETLRKLKLDSSTLQKTIVGNVQSYMDNELRGWFFGLGKVKFKKSDNEKVRGKCNKVISEYTTDFLKNRFNILDTEGKDFLGKVKQKIMDNGQISDAAKKFFVNVPEPKIPDPEKVADLGDTYKAHKYTEGAWIFKTDYLDKDAFMKDVKSILLGIVEKMGKNYRKDYRDSLETILLQVKSNFITNLETYSISMQAMIEDRDAMMELGQRVLDAADDLRKCEGDLNEIIWKEVE